MFDVNILYFLCLGEGFIFDYDQDSKANWEPFRLTEIIVWWNLLNNK